MVRSMSVDFESLSDVLKHPIRRRIILALSEGKSMSYVDLMNLVEVTNTGRFNYHLKILADLIEKDGNGKYGLSDKGRLAVQFLQKFGEKEDKQTPLRMADAVLIGFVGSILAGANPGFWSFYLFATLGINVSVLFFVAAGLLSFAFALLLPGAVIWLLAIRRAHSHDAYDLFKPPFVTFILLLVVLLVMFFLRISLTVTLTTAPTSVPSGNPNESVTRQSIMQTSYSLILLLGSVFSFLGVIIAELGSRIRERMTF
jgi:hypothetical protein